MLKKIIFFFLPTLVLFSKEEPATYTLIEDQSTLRIISPSFADRKTAKLRLANGLEAFLISDPGAEQSGAALAVEAGSWQDPEEYPGMAHFLEHMLFMGNQAYPNEFEYMQFITDHAGVVNAYTANDRTVYMFSVNNDALQDALDRFSHFFIDPLFLPSCIGRELHAVDQEHAKNVENDAWREYMVLKETGNPSHPNAAFSTGNADTLMGIPQASLKSWYEEHYSSDRMHLVLLSPLPIDELISLTAARFSSVPKRATKRLPQLSFLTSVKQQGHFIYLKPIKDLKNLSLIWEIPSEFAKDQEKWAPQLFAHILGNEGEESLIMQLKREKLAENLRVSIDRLGGGEKLLMIDISLTQRGVACVETIVERTFQAINILKRKELPSYLFEEMQQLCKIGYEYQGREDPFFLVMRHADSLLDEDLASYPQKTALPTAYDPQFFSSFLQTLTPSSCIFFIVADPALTGVVPTCREKWMSAEYTLREIPKDKLTLWAEISPHPQIAIAKKNPFVPSKLDLLSVNTETQKKVIPSLLVDDPLGKLYFAQDNRYRTPQSSLLFNLKSPLLDGSEKSIVLAELYLKSLYEMLFSILQLADTAGIRANATIEDVTMTFSVEGYSEKAPLLLKAIFQALHTVAPSPELFELYRDTYLSRYINAQKELPFVQGKELAYHLFFENTPLNSQKALCLKNLSYEEFIHFCKSFGKQCFIEGSIFGNLTSQDASSLWEEVKELLRAEPFPKAAQKKSRTLALSNKAGPFLIHETTERQGNASLLVVEQGPFTFEKRACQRILATALQEKFFDTLRTKQQTAYIAKAWDDERAGQLLQSFGVQSSTHSPQELLARFELFLEDFVRNFEEIITLERFETLKEMLITWLNIPPENVSTMAWRLHTLAFEYDGDFTRYDKETNALKHLEYSKLKQYAEQCFSRSNGKRLAILIEGSPSSEESFRYEIIAKEDVSSIGEYVSWKE